MVQSFQGMLYLVRFGQIGTIYYDISGTFKISFLFESKWNKRIFNSPRFFLFGANLVQLRSNLTSLLLLSLEINKNW